MDDATLRDIHRYRRVSDRMATAGQPTEDQLRAVAEAGCTAVINLGLHGADYALPDERTLVESLGMAYVHIPVIWERPTLEDLDQFSAVMRARDAECLFVHCAANVRVTVFVALDRVRHLGWRTEDAFAGFDLESLPEVWRRFVDRALARDPG